MPSRSNFGTSTLEQKFGYTRRLPEFSEFEVGALLIAARGCDTAEQVHLRYTSLVDAKPTPIRGLGHKTPEQISAMMYALVRTPINNQKLHEMNAMFPLQRVHTATFLSAQEARLCSFCRKSGHTRPNCPEREVPRRQAQESAERMSSVIDSIESAQSLSRSTSTSVSDVALSYVAGSTLNQSASSRLLGESDHVDSQDAAPHPLDSSLGQALSSPILESRHVPFSEAEVFFAH
jgi:hypothetical protein